MTSSVRKIDRTGMRTRLGVDEIINRYRHNYKLGPEITMNEISEHARLEGELADELLATTEENRSEIFSWAYSRLYSELPWLAGTGTRDGAERWASLFRPGSSIYEVGSGAGYLIRYLSDNGFNCVQTDISTRRETLCDAKAAEIPREFTDGVHLSKYADIESFDYVISNQVVEHLHPDDLLVHFQEARKLLKPGGQYIMATPYAPFGPADLSRVFGFDRPVFMHLHELTISDTLRIARRAGYNQALAIFSLPKLRISARSKLYTHYLALFDKMLTHDQNNALKRAIKACRKPLLIGTNIFMSLEK